MHDSLGETSWKEPPAGLATAFCPQCNRYRPREYFRSPLDHVGDRVHAEGRRGVGGGAVERVVVLRGEAPKDLGDGDGDGDGDGHDYWLATIPSLTSSWPPEQRARLEAARAEGAVIAFWRSRKDGRPSNGGTGGARSVGHVETVPGPLRLCGASALHATEQPQKWEGRKVWVVALFGEVAREGDKLGALRREILSEAWTRGED